ncbi:MAG: hypothetical protein KFF68_02625, partial [Desulfosarcina sp.]|nr:hypothetical protein [Desulfosarcina sp.]
ANGLKGAAAEKALESVGIVLNRNVIPSDARTPGSVSGLRLGSAGITTRGMGQPEMVLLWTLTWRLLIGIHQILPGLSVSIQGLGQLGDHLVGDRIVSPAIHGIDVFVAGGFQVGHRFQGESHALSALQGGWPVAVGGSNFLDLLRIRRKQRQDVPGPRTKVLMSIFQPFQQTFKIRSASRHRVGHLPDFSGQFLFTIFYGCLKKAGQHQTT